MQHFNRRYEVANSQTLERLSLCIQHVPLIVYDNAILGRFVDEHIIPELDRHLGLVPDEGRQHYRLLIAVPVENDVRYGESDETTRTSEA